MSKTPTNQTTPRRPAKIDAIPYQILFTPAIMRQVDSAAALLGMTKQAVCRMSLERGIPILVQQLTRMPIISQSEEEA